MSKVIRTSRHALKFSNTAKRAVLVEFLDAYKKALSVYISYLWNSRIEWDGRILDISKSQGTDPELLQCPLLISTTDVKFESPLLSRALKCAATQACGMVASVTRARLKDMEKIAFLEKSNRKIPDRLRKKVNNPLTMPVVIKDIKAELNSICSELKLGESKHFDGYLKLKSLFKDKGHGFSIKLPIKHHRQSRKLESRGTRLNSFLVSRDSIEIRYEIKPTPSKGKQTIGVDSGLKTAYSCSDGVCSGKNRHGYDLESILIKMSRRRKGSKSFGRAQSERDNYINWSINQLNLSKIGKIYFEDNKDIKFAQRTSRLMSHWTHRKIKRKFEMKAEDAGVQISLSSSEYNSQRCRMCGWVQRKNRKGKEFCCLKCWHTNDADVNAAQNVAIRQTLPRLPYEFISRKLNRTGVYWLESGLFFSDGLEITVPNSNKA